MIKLTDDELFALREVLYDYVYYGSDEIVYGDGEDARIIRSAYLKIDAEQEKRRLK